MNVHMASLQMGVISIHHNMSFPKGLPNIGHMQTQTRAQEKPQHKHDYVFCVKYENNSF